MKYFVTGGSGFIGSHLVPKLISSGHAVLALARSEASADKLKSWGAEAVLGNLEDIELLAKCTKETDGVIHLGWFSRTDFPKSTEIDKVAIEAMGDALVGSNKVFIGTSGTLSYVFSGVEVATEDTPIAKQGPPLLDRCKNEYLLLSYAEKGVRTAVIRLSPTVHEKTQAGFISAVAPIMKAAGVAVYADEGTNAWPSAHVEDIADLYVLAAEKVPGNTVLHGVAEEAITIKEITKAIGAKHGIPVKSVSKEELNATLGPFFGALYASNNRVSSAKTRELTGWNPKNVKLLEDYTS